MGTIIRTERRRRGFFGWIFLLLFVAFNLFMLMWLALYLNVIYRVSAGDDLASHPGLVLGGSIGTGVILFVWTCGAIILGLLTLLSRGRKVVIEKYDHREPRF